MSKGNWLIIIVIVGLLAGAVQLDYKAQTETLYRQVGLAVDAGEVRDAAWWPTLSQAGVRFALVHDPAEASGLPTGLRPVEWVTTANWPAWRDSKLVPAAVIFAENRLPDQFAPILPAWQGIPAGLIDLISPADFAVYPNAWLGQLLRVYDRPAHAFINEFTIAVRERQDDLVVVRLFADQTAEQNLAHVQAVSQALLAEGHHLTDQLQPRPLFPGLAWVYDLQALALGAVLALAGRLLLGRSGPAIGNWLLPAATALAALALPYLVGWIMSRQVLALAYAIAYPSLGLLWWWRRAERPGDDRQAAWHSLLDWLAVTACALAGGLAVHAALSLPAFQIKEFQFAGVKLAYALPILFSVVLVTGHWLRYSIGGSRLSSGLWQWMGGVLGLLVLALVVYVLFNRAGNESVVPIGPWELTFRDWLAKVLWVRPRTKEFLGYPVLIGGFFLWRRGSRLLGGLAVLVGFIGELSLVNTFEHLHHPILLSLLRSGLGLAIGLVLGLVGLAALRLIWPAREGWR